TFRGHSTDFGPPAPKEESAPADKAADGDPVHHRVDMVPLREFFLNFLGFDIKCEIEVADWLTLPDQKLRAITAGAVYHDGVGLQAVRDRFAYYPHDVWLYLLAAAWDRLHPEANLLG